MSYDPMLPTLEESVRAKVVAMIVASLADLNTSLNRDGLSPMSFSADQVVQGDTHYLTRSRISVTGGGEANATDTTSEPYFAPITDTAGYKVEIYTEVIAYIHPDEMPHDDPETQGAYHEVAIQRIAGHLRRRVLNDKASRAITLSSREYATAPNYDVLKMCYARQAFVGTAPKMVGDWAEVLSVRLLHVGTMS